MKAHHSAKSVERPTSTTEIVAAAARLADAGHVDQALHLIVSSKSLAPEITNARGVCLMRLGQTNDAVQLYRSLVLQSGCTWLKPGLPVIHCTNFATALLLANLPLGARDTLAQMTAQDHPSVVRLRAAMKSWEQKLPLWVKMTWKIGLSPNVPVTLDFAPGDFVDVQTNSPTSP